MEKWFQAHGDVRLVNIAELAEAVHQRIYLFKCARHLPVGRKLAKQNRGLLAKHVVVRLCPEICIFVLGRIDLVD